MSGARDPLGTNAWKDTVSGYQHASTGRALWQLTNTFAPYALLWCAMYWAHQHWRWEHAIHHGSAGNLDRRGTGDVWTMTVEEYLNAS